MLNNMLQFNIGLLQGIVTFLSSEPIIYIVGFILACCVIKILKLFINFT